MQAARGKERRPSASVPARGGANPGGTCVHGGGHPRGAAPGALPQRGCHRLGCSGGTSGYGKPTANPRSSLTGAMWRVQRFGGEGEVTKTPFHHCDLQQIGLLRLPTLNVN